MSERAAKSAQATQAHRGVAYAIPHAQVEEHWSSIEGQLRIMEKWTQLMSADDVRLGLGDGSMQIWAAIDHAGKPGLAITRLSHGSRGASCTLWLVASHLSDDATIAALVNECEAFTRGQGCSVFEINAYPGLAERIPGKVTAITIERDLRGSRRMN